MLSRDTAVQLSPRSLALLVTNRVLCQRNAGRHCSNVALLVRAGVFFQISACSIHGTRGRTLQTVCSRHAMSCVPPSAAVKVPECPASDRCGDADPARGELSTDRRCLARQALAPSKGAMDLASQLRAMSRALPPPDPRASAASMPAAAGTAPRAGATVWEQAARLSLLSSRVRPGWPLLCRNAASESHAPLMTSGKSHLAALSDQPEGV